MQDKILQLEKSKHVEVTWFEHVIDFGRHAAPLLLVFISFSLASRAFTHKGNHFGLLVIEMCYLVLTFALTFGYVYGRKQYRIGTAVFLAMTVILMLNSGVGFFITEAGYMPETSPRLLQWWFTNLLAYTAVISASLLLIFSMADGRILERIEQADHRMYVENAGRRIGRAEKRAESKAKIANAIAMEVAAGRLVRRVRKLAKSADFTPQAQYILSEAVQGIDGKLPLLEMGKSVQVNATVPNGVSRNGKL